tara:strand:+ start:417 stop:1139 length:723 start_codon:yes stop_codon:yes gene_type:complete
MKFKFLKSPNFSRKPRKKDKIKFIVIHYTGMQSKRVSINRLLSPNHKVSCHYFIDRKGKIIQMAEDTKIAWHAGKSKWKSFSNLNKNSIGIELDNKGHKLGYQSFPNSQINQLIRLCRKLKKKYKIKNQCILGHSDIAPLRKVDPGEKFPWFFLKKRGVSIYHSKENIEGDFKSSNKNIIRNVFFKNIYKIGYRYFSKKKPLNTDKLVIKSFQRRFRPKKVSGLIDPESLAISKYLSKIS